MAAESTKCFKPPKHTFVSGFVFYVGIADEALVFNWGGGWNWGCVTVGRWAGGSLACFGLAWFSVALLHVDIGNVFKVVFFNVVLLICLLLCSERCMLNMHCTY